MKETIVLVLALLAVASIRCSELGKDGFNYYKDYLRARSDEAMLEGPSPGERMLYFYRTPLQLYPGLLPAIEQEYRKRTGNVFKNHMLSKELLGQDEKRSSKTALSMMLQGKQDPYYALKTPREDFVDLPRVDIN
ncbi:uncharacterized protein LOC114360281 isoform X1 [Ostrinia furnacalis]|uniref:uncharacterized protein LOC114360281 isoform X1 n=2 Tax=Ostrinia furnacalis TaxID=93504 RepID=UPI0010387627|nr:uncharacterized protein LOC114360281 isoform X1 [Ostrinia furnacalis]